MKHMIIWHDNGNRSVTFEWCGYSEEITDRTPEEICAEYEAHGCCVFSVDVLSTEPSAPEVTRAERN